MPIPNYGTNTTFQTLAASTLNILEFNEDRAWDAIMAQTAIHEAQTQMMVSSLVQPPTTDKFLRYGTNDRMEMQEIDEVSRVDAQRVTSGSTIGLPLKRFQELLQWTLDYFENATGAEIAAQVEAAYDADTRNVMRNIKKTWYSPINYTTWDRFVRPQDTVDIPVKALVNADGAAIPMGADAQEFDASSHTHYLALDWTNGATTSAQKNASVVQAMETVLEHYKGGTLAIVINRTDETSVKALPEFIPYTYTNMVLPNTTSYSTAKVLDPYNLYNRAIGQFRGAEVWVKPWPIAGYINFWLNGQAAPIGWREKKAGSSGFRLVYEDEEHPLRCKMFEREFGLGVWERTNGAILDIYHGTYTAPTAAQIG